MPELELTLETILIALSLQTCFLIGLRFFKRKACVNCLFSSKTVWKESEKIDCLLNGQNGSMFTIHFLSFLVKKRKRREGSDDSEGHLFLLVKPKIAKA